MGRAKDFIVKTLGLETGHSVEMGAIHAGDFMVSLHFLTSTLNLIWYLTLRSCCWILQKRFCSNLGMSHQAVRAAEEAVKKSEEFDIRYLPHSFGNL